MVGEKAERIRNGLELWNTVAGSEDEGVVRAAIEEMNSAYHEDCELDFSRTLPDFEPTRGPEAMATWMMSSRDIVDDVTFAPGELIEEGDAVIAAVRLTAKVRGSSAPIQMDYAYVFRWRDDKIASATTYRTMPEALDAARGTS
jgi:ketosteroid isomerase-like protein